MDERYIFRALLETEAPQMFQMVQDRIAWMNQRGIRGWNTTEYQERYPLSYYAARARRQEAFGLVRRTDGRIVCAGVLLREDPRWAGSTSSAAYLHNFVADTAERGAGAIFLAQAEEWARAQGIRFLRLDCVEENTAINAYYEAKGFYPAGKCSDGPYHGILREKKISSI